MQLIQKARQNTEAVNAPFVRDVTKKLILTASSEGDDYILIKADDMLEQEIRGLKEEKFKVTYYEGNFPDECYYKISWRLSLFERFLLMTGLK